MLTKRLFIILAICFSSVMIISFSSSVNFVELEPLSLKYGLPFFQCSLLLLRPQHWKNMFFTLLRDSDKNFTDFCIFAS